MSQTNRIYKGIVTSNSDITRSGILTVQIDGFGEGSIEVVYTSPFYHLNGGGFLAIPEIGSKILIHYDENENKYYYLSTIVEMPENSQRGGLKEWKLIGDNYVYTEREIPQRVEFTDGFGAGLKISQRNLPSYISAKVDLDSRAGKRLSLSDSPNSDMVLIRNEHGDGMVISSEPSEIHSERSIEVKSKGSQKHIVFQSDMYLAVIEGRDITIENFSTGTFKQADTPGRFGNINLRSQNADINIVSNGDDGRVFLVTPKARIQIDSDGSIKLESDSNVQIVAKGDINVKSDNNINLEATNINIRSNSDINMQALQGGISAKGAGNVALDGAQVHLNSNQSNATSAVQVITPELTDYEE